jgi:hypothetical protein
MRQVTADGRLHAAKLHRMLLRGNRCQALNFRKMAGNMAIHELRRFFVWLKICLAYNCQAWYITFIAFPETYVIWGQVPGVCIFYANYGGLSETNRVSGMVPCL